jgi:hypothetical protein
MLMHYNHKLTTWTTFIYIYIYVTLKKVWKHALIEFVHQTLYVVGENMYGIGTGSHELKYGLADHQRHQQQTEIPNQCKDLHMFDIWNTYCLWPGALSSFYFIFMFLYKLLYLVFIFSTNSYITVAFNCGYCFSQIWNTARPKSHGVPTGTNCHALHHELKHQDKSAPIEAMDFEHYKCLSHVGSVFKIIYRK